MKSAYSSSFFLIPFTYKNKNQKEKYRVAPKVYVNICSLKNWLAILYSSSRIGARAEVIGTALKI
jgi:hypothetical protein